MGDLGRLPPRGGLCGGGYRSAGSCGGFQLADGGLGLSRVILPEQDIEQAGEVPYDGDEGDLGRLAAAG